MKTISKESLEELMKNLENVEKPVKETFTRREAIEKLKPKIKELKRQGWSYKEIAQVITEQSQNELRLRPKEAEEICAGRKRRDVLEDSELTQPSRDFSQTSDTPDNGSDVDTTGGEIEAAVETSMNDAERAENQED